jgi:hypothetical protein
MGTGDYRTLRDPHRDPPSETGVKLFFTSASADLPAVEALFDCKFGRNPVATKLLPAHGRPWTCVCEIKPESLGFWPGLWKCVEARGRCLKGMRLIRLQVAALKTPGRRQIVGRVDVGCHAHVGRLDFDQFVGVERADQPARALVAFQAHRRFE